MPKPPLPDELQRVLENPNPAVIGSVSPDGAPNTVAPSFHGWPRAISRAETTGLRLTAAIATAALSMMRLMIIAATSFSTGVRSAATPAIFHAS